MTGTYAPTNRARRILIAVLAFALAIGFASAASIAPADAARDEKNFTVTELIPALHKTPLKHIVLSEAAIVLSQNGLSGSLSSFSVIAQDAFELADQAVADALQPIVDKVASMIGDAKTVRLAPGKLSEWPDQQQILQGREAWETARDWLDRVNPRLSFEVGDRYAASRAITDAQINEAKQAKGEIVKRMDEVAASRKPNVRWKSSEGA